jgi:hypothetical protein
MQADAADLDTRPRLRPRAQQPRKPRQGHTQGPAVRQFDSHCALVKSDGRCRNGHGVTPVRPKALVPRDECEEFPPHRP